MTNAADLLLNLGPADLDALLSDAYERVDSARGLRETTKAIDWKRTVRAARAINSLGVTEKRAKAFNAARKDLLS